MSREDAVEVALQAGPAHDVVERRRRRSRCLPPSPPAVVEDVAVIAAVPLVRQVCAVEATRPIFAAGSSRPPPRIRMEPLINGSSWSSCRKITSAIRQFDALRLHGLEGSAAAGWGSSSTAAPVVGS